MDDRVSKLFYEANQVTNRLVVNAKDVSNATSTYHSSAKKIRIGAHAYVFQRVGGSSKPTVKKGLMLEVSLGKIKFRTGNVWSVNQTHTEGDSQVTPHGNVAC
ncbi:hypothetical protein [Haloechinothrix salitolerans]|uniref:Uncharacterized protein n=1 Tax=Haloechinothrix salitolerans TaxID=926830 RepID=A0ABW2BZH4_9PSEU